MLKGYLLIGGQLEMLFDSMDEQVLNSLVKWFDIENGEMTICVKYEPWMDKRKLNERKIKAC